MSKIKQLASQTVWYGGSNIVSKLLNYLTNPLLTYLLGSKAGMVDFGDISILYAWIAVANILFTYGFETAYFKFSNMEDVNKKTLFQTSFSSLVFSSFVLFLLLNFVRFPLSRFVEQYGHPEYVTYALLIIVFDTLSVIPLAKLRQESRPKRYAFVNISGVIINVVLQVFFIGISPSWVEKNPTGWYSQWYLAHSRVTLVMYANLAQAMLAFLLLMPQWKQIKLKINIPLWKRLFAYSSPMIIIGLAGMVNEVMDRMLLLKFVPGSIDNAKTVAGIYTANYKLAIVVTLFIQAFRMAAEPFFFNQARDKHAPYLYARIMKWFVIVVSIAFLVTVLYIDIWKMLVGPSYRSGLGVVPILLLANIFLGMYYTQSVWYKITNNMRIGMYITLIGAIITLLINILFIPRFGMFASAWATCICYGSMMVISYFWGRRYYPIPYNVKKILAYIVVILLLFFLQKLVMAVISNVIVHFITASIFMAAFLLLVTFAERKELVSFPVIGRYIAKIKK